ncbi:MAG TPA: RsiV family protein [Gammaproteobacteria bacterium]|nr:RsiV family protein [Gammaproteobacteria bacterium]
MKRLLALSCLLAVFAHTPALADDEDDGIDNPHAYHLNGDMDLVSTDKIVYDKPKIIAKMVYPKLTSENEADEVENFNDAVKDLLDTELQTFKDKVNELQLNAPKQKTSSHLNIDFDSSTLNITKTPIFSIRFVIEGYIPRMAHPYQYHQVLNMSLDDDTTLSLDELFKPNSNYLFWLSNYTTGVLAKKIPADALLEDGLTPTPDHFKLWNLEPTGMRFTFDSATVAPSYYGTQSVVVPYALLQPMLAPDSVLAECLNHRKSCLKNHLLTGGFLN